MSTRILLASLCLAATPMAFGAETPHFAYSGDHGPQNWSSLSPDFAACAAGKSQSPVNIAGMHHASLPKLNVSYSTLATNFVNNGHAVQANYGAGSTLSDDYHAAAPYKAHVNYESGSTIGHLDSTFELKQFHFHSPSEHQRDGKNLPAEVHFVHADADGNLAVIGVFVEIGAAHPTIAQLWQKIPATEGQANALDSPISANDLLPADRGYFYYPGSLTTPPCSEGVRWIVMKQPITMSEEQVAALRASIGFANNRPVQPLNGRIIFE